MSTIIGLNALQAKLTGLVAGAQEIGDTARDAIADGIAEDARAYVPVDTGALHGTIRVEDGQVLAGDPNVDYASIVEFDEDAHPYMRPAADGAIRHVPEAVTEARVAIEVIV